MARRQKKTGAMGLFLSFFLKAVVIILGLVILAMGAYLIRASISVKNEKKQKTAEEDAFEDDQSDELLTAEPTKDDEELLYEDPSSTEAEGVTDLPMDSSIVVLNATETAGLAAAWKEKLSALGYTNIQTGNYTGGLLENTKIVITDEKYGGNNLINTLPNATLENASADTVSCDVAPDGVIAYIIIGTSDDIVTTQ